MNGLYYLAHLVALKNDLNRKRRRFYALMNPGKEHIKVHKEDKHYNPKWDWDNQGWSHYSIVLPMHPAYTKLQAKQGYKQAQQEMKAMTAHMRKVRTEIGATLIWGSGGQINAIKHENKTYHSRAPIWNELGYNTYTGHNEILALANQYRADSILLAD